MQPAGVPPSAGGVVTTIPGSNELAPAAVILPSRRLWLAAVGQYA